MRAIAKVLGRLLKLISEGYIKSCELSELVITQHTCLLKNADQAVKSISLYG